MCIGFTFEKGKIFLPRVIKAQMTFQDFSMMKMFLAGTSVSMIGIAFLTATKLQNRVATKLALGFGLLRGFGANIVGGLIMGAGIFVSGACPGTLMAQVGSGVPKSLWTLAGAFTGAGLFVLVHSVTRKTDFHKKEPTEKIDEFFGVSMWKMSVGFGIIVAIIVSLLEYSSPYSETLKIHQNNGDWNSPSWILDPYAAAWSPITSGVLMGLLQLPVFYLLDQNIAVSSSYILVAGLGCSAASGGSCDQKYPYFKNFYSSGDFGQLASTVGIALGAYISATMSGVEINYDDMHASAARSFVGGMFVLFGARLAGGCASGHGLSGVARLSAASLVVTASMFAGAIGLGMFSTFVW